MNRIISEFLRTPWAILPEQLSTMAMILYRWSAGLKLNEHEIRAAIGNDPEIAAARRASNANSPGHVAVLSLFGIVSNRIHQVRDISGPGGTSTEGFSKAFQSAMNNPGIGAIVIDINSPGGSVHGVSELAAQIRAARGEKKIVAVANSVAASAAYWIGSAAEELVVAPGSDTGSIGVIAMHEDWSDFVNNIDSKIAIPKIEYITAGEFKAEGNPFEPLSDEARAFMQQRVDEYYIDFVNAIAKNRGVSTAKINKDFGQGRVFGADQAVSSGMADRIDTLDNVIAGLTGSKRAQTSRSKARAEQKLNLLERN